MLLKINQKESKQVSKPRCHLVNLKEGRLDDNYKQLKLE